MRKQILRSFLGLSIGAFSMASYAQTRPTFVTLQILGHHLGDAREKVDARLLAVGYKRTGDAYPKCDRTFEATIEEFARDNRTKIPASTLDCTEIYSKGVNAVTAQYLLGQRGYVLSSMIFDYKTTETAKSGLARWSKLYGKADSSEEGIFRWRTSTSKRGPYFQYGRTSSTSTIYITDDWVMSHAFYKEAEKFVSRAAQRSE